MMDVSMEHTKSPSPALKVQSISRRFSYGFIGIVTLILFTFAAIAIFVNVTRLGTELQKKLENIVELSQISLPTPLWNLDNDIVQDYIEALFLDKALVYAEVVWEGTVITTKTRPKFQDKDFAYFAQSPKFLTQTADILFEGSQVGTIQFALSRAGIKHELLLNIVGIIALTILLIVAIFLTSIVITRRSIARPLSQLQQSATRIAGGDLEAEINTSSSDEIGLLARDLKAMRESIKRLFGEIRHSNAQLEEANYTLESRVTERTEQLAQANAEITSLNEQLKAENLRLGAELDVTRKIQRMLLPTEAELRQIEELDIACYMEPADEVGGDYYDVLQHQGRIKIGIGDVTGHGLESGVVMVMTQAVVRALLTIGETDPVRFLDTVNRALYGNVQRMGTDKNLTLSLLDYAAGQVRLSGQHEEMIVVRQDGAVELVDTIDLGFPIGLAVEIAEFIDQTTVALQPGDGVVLYTDGITEAENGAGEHYSLERLCGVLSQHWAQSAEAIKGAVVADVQRHIGTQHVYDDITLVVVKRKK
jgi:serine phosphatase RsbU (regulator of sigma subunit)